MSNNTKFFIPQVLGNYVLGRLEVNEKMKEVWISGITIQTVEFDDDRVIARTTDCEYTLAQCRTRTDAMRECFHVIMSMNQSSQSTTEQPGE